MKALMMSILTILPILAIAQPSTGSTQATASAKTDAKIVTLKRLYATAEPNTMAHATPSLRRLIEQANHNEYPCIDYEPAVQAQEIDRLKVLSMLSVNANTVRVRISNVGQIYTLDYKMACSNGKCLIDDVITSSHSLRREALQCLAERKR